MSELTLQQILDTGISLEEILLNKDPVQVDVTVDTTDLAATMQADRNKSLDILNELKSNLIKNNELNRDLLIKALSLVIKNSSMTVDNSQREITGLKVIREPHTKLMDTLNILRD